MGHHIIFIYYFTLPKMEANRFPQSANFVGHFVPLFAIAISQGDSKQNQTSKPNRVALNWIMKDKLITY